MVSKALLATVLLLGNSALAANIGRDGPSDQDSHAAVTHSSGHAHHTGKPSFHPSGEEGHAHLTVSHDGPAPTEGFGKHGQGSPDAKAPSDEHSHPSQPSPSPEPFERRQASPSHAVTSTMTGHPHHPTGTGIPEEIFEELKSFFEQFSGSFPPRPTGTERPDLGKLFKSLSGLIPHPTGADFPKDGPPMHMSGSMSLPHPTATGRPGEPGTQAPPTKDEYENSNERRQNDDKDGKESSSVAHDSGNDAPALPTNAGDYAKQFSGSVPSHPDPTGASTPQDGSHGPGSDDGTHPPHDHKSGSMHPPHPTAGPDTGNSKGFHGSPGLSSPIAKPTDKSAEDQPVGQAGQDSGPTPTGPIPTQSPVGRRDMFATVLRA